MLAAGTYRPTALISSCSKRLADESAHAERILWSCRCHFSPFRENGASIAEFGARLLSALGNFEKDGAGKRDSDDDDRQRRQGRRRALTYFACQYGHQGLVS